MELFGILEMFLVCNSELMSTVKRRTGAEIQIAMFIRIQNGIQTCLRRHIDRSRRKTYILICIIR